jgi:hypothetical protein
MKKIFYISICLLLLFSCDSGTSPSSGDSSDTVMEFSGITYRYDFDGANLNYIADYNFEEVSRSIPAGETVTGVSEIPGVGTVVATDANKYYIESGSTFVDLTLPAGTSNLHIYQFTKFNGDIYFGVDNRLYKDNDTDFSNATLVIDGNIFNSAEDTLKTNLHYIVNTDGTVRYWPGDSNSTERLKEYLSTDNVNPIGGTQYVRNNLHVEYFTMNDSGEMRNFNNAVISYSNISTVSSIDSYSAVGWGQSQETSSTALVNNRINTADTYFWSATKFYMPRDTMFRQFRDRKVYLGTDTDRIYIGIDRTGSDIKVEIFENNHGSVASVRTFNVDYEDETLIPNMWATDTDVYVIKSNTLYKNGQTDLVYAHTARLDAVTVLPNGDVIVMDETGAWFKSDGSTFSGDNIIAQY